MSDQLTRLESFPFTSIYTGYDKTGRPVYDRAVGSKMLRQAFRQFFMDGVFPQPANNLMITKGAQYDVVIQRGEAIIDGGFGGVVDPEGMTLTLTNEPPRGDTTFSIFVRLDDNFDKRSLYFRVAQTVGNDPAEPEFVEGVVKELRLGYVTLPSNAQSIEEGTIHNEKGTEVCPYASSFEKIDISAILADVMQQAQCAYDRLVELIRANMDFVNSLLDDTVAGNLQAQINDLAIDAVQTSDLDERNLMVSGCKVKLAPGAGDEVNIHLNDDSALEIIDNSIGEDKIDSELIDSISIVDDEMILPNGNNIKFPSEVLNTSSYVIYGRWIAPSGKEVHLYLDSSANTKRATARVYSSNGTVIFNKDIYYGLDFVRNPNIPTICGIYEYGANGYDIYLYILAGIWSKSTMIHFRISNDVFSIIGYSQIERPNILYRLTFNNILMNDEWVAICGDSSAYGTNDWELKLNRQGVLRITPLKIVKNISGTQNFTDSASRLTYADDYGIRVQSYATRNSVALVYLNNEETVVISDKLTGYNCIGDCRKFARFIIDENSSALNLIIFNVDEYGILSEFYRKKIELPDEKIDITGEMFLESQDMPLFPNIANVNFIFKLKNNKIMAQFFTDDSRSANQSTVKLMTYYYNEKSGIVKSNAYSKVTLERLMSNHGYTTTEVGNFNSNGFGNFVYLMNASKDESLHLLKKVLFELSEESGVGVICEF